MKRRLTANALIGILRDRPAVFVIRMHVRSKGTVFCLSDNLRMIDQAVIDRLVAKGCLTERGDTIPLMGAPGQILELSAGWRS